MTAFPYSASVPTSGDSDARLLFLLCFLLSLSNPSSPPLSPLFSISVVDFGAPAAPGDGDDLLFLLLLSLSSLTPEIFPPSSR